MGPVPTSPKFLDRPHRRATAISLAASLLLTVGVTSLSQPGAAADGSKYKVFPPPIAAPTYSDTLPPGDGRVTVAEPADLAASPFGWHDTDGVAGAEYTITRGNNVWVGVDADGLDGIDPGTEYDGGAGLDFLPSIDLSASASTNSAAGVVNAFFVANHLHDYFYAYGFDEVSGNFQQNNYGNGGAGSDPVRIDTLDTAGTNDVNVVTPADGGSPRIQLFEWNLGSAPTRNGALDNGIVAWAYSQAVVSRLAGGPTNAGCLSGALHVASWGDYFGVLTTIRSSDTGATPGRSAATASAALPPASEFARTRTQPSCRVRPAPSIRAHSPTHRPPRSMIAHLSSRRCCGR